MMGYRDHVYGEVRDRRASIVASSMSWPVLQPRKGGMAGDTLPAFIDKSS